MGLVIPPGSILLYPRTEVEEPILRMLAHFAETEPRMHHPSGGGGVVFASGHLC